MIIFSEAKRNFQKLPITLVVSFELEDAKARSYLRHLIRTKRKSIISAVFSFPSGLQNTE